MANYLGKNDMKPCIVSIFMKNVDQNVVLKQKEIVEKFNKSKIPHYQVYTEVDPGYTMDKLVDMLEKKNMMQSCILISMRCH